MKLTLPTGENKPAWGALFGAASMVYLFVDPWRTGASWLEWSITSLVFCLFLAAYVIGVIYWREPSIVRRVCAAIFILALLFSAYQPSGVILFAYVAALGPFAVGGHVIRSMLVIGAAVAALLVEWWLFWPADVFPYVFAAVALVLGGAMTVVAREQVVVERMHKAAERERIARDLHDILGHTLSVITLKAELAGRLLLADPLRARHEIGEVERISRDALGEIREAISGYRTGDLAMELQNATTVLRSAGIAVDKKSQTIKLPLTQERLLSLVLREATTNIIRHAHADRCHIELTRDDTHVRMTVRDNGRGGVLNEGFGMRGMRERIAEAGGDISWHSDAGTIVTVMLPLPATTE